MLQHFPGVNAESIVDMVLVRISGRTAGQVSAVAFAMIRRRNSSIWMVSNTEASSVILAEMPDLYYDIRNEMISEKIALRDDRFEQVRR